MEVHVDMGGMDYSEAKSLVMSVLTSLDRDTRSIIMGEAIEYFSEQDEYLDEDTLFLGSDEFYESDGQFFLGCNYEDDEDFFWNNV